MAEAIDKIAAVQRIRDIYKANLLKINDGLSDYVNNSRQSALDAFERMGIPSFKNENYKYTDLTRLFRKRELQACL